MSVKTKGAVIAVAVAALALGGCVAPKGEHGHAQTNVKCAGANACKGKSECATATNACKGKNSCRGKGVVHMEDSACLDKGGLIMER